MKITTKNEKETIDLACYLAKNLKQGDIIVLSGELGSGKTKFTEGILKYFGLEDEISSPTFTIVNEHISDKMNIFHFDVYRLEDCDEFYAMGGEEYFNKGICIIEWGEIIKDILPPDYVKVIFKKSEEDENLRELLFEPHGDFDLRRFNLENTCN